MHGAAEPRIHGRLWPADRAAVSWSFSRETFDFENSLSTSHPPARRAHGPHGRGNFRGKRGGSATQRGATSGAAHAKIAPLQPTDTPPDIHSFSEWNLGDEIQGAIAGMNISVPTPIQKLAIGPVLEGRDVIAKAETGTGKTLAFGAPMMAKIDPARASVLGLVLCPTRELAEQVCKVLAALGEPRKIKTALIVGGEPLEPQVTALKGGAQVVVGTPGRILDLYKQRFLSFPWTEFTILDEADVMLEIGFIDDVKQILSYAPDERQTLLFSATFPPELLKLAREHTKNPVEVATASGIATVDTIEQSFMLVDDDDRPLALIRMIEQSEKDDVFLVFCDRRTEVDKLMRRLERMPWPVKALHGGYDQEARFRVMTAFRSREVKALVATDVASRGLDVAHVTHVVNYSSPRDVTDYTHRIGRTGRAGRSGRAITLVTPLGMRRWKGVLREANWKIEEAPLPGSTRDHERRRESPRRAPEEAASERAPRESPRREREPRHAPPREREAHGEPRGRHDARDESAQGGRNAPQATQREREPRAPLHGDAHAGRSASADTDRSRWPVDQSEERSAAAHAREWRERSDRAREPRETERGADLPDRSTDRPPAPPLAHRGREAGPRAAEPAQPASSRSTARAHGERTQDSSRMRPEARQSADAHDARRGSQRAQRDEPRGQSHEPRTQRDEPRVQRDERTQRAEPRSNRDPRRGARDAAHVRETPATGEVSHRARPEESPRGRSNAQEQAPQQRRSQREPREPARESSPESAPESPRESALDPSRESAHQAAPRSRHDTRRSATREAAPGAAPEAAGNPAARDARRATRSDARRTARPEDARGARHGAPQDPRHGARREGARPRESERPRRDEPQRGARERTDFGSGL
jgi:ATP-dependent RNA helicase DeaD